MANLGIMAHLAAVALVLCSSLVTALTIEYCSDANTASSSTLTTYTYQSNGYCENICNSDYAFAVLQGKNCWCSDYVPASQTNVSNCDSPCPGYPSDLCGNTSEGLYGYIAMSNVQPSGTAAGTTGTGSVSTTSTSSSSSSTSTSDPPTTTSPTISISTQAGKVVTVTIADSSSTSTSVASSSSGKSSSLSGGAIAGIVVGSIAGVGAIAAFALWYFFFGRRRNDNRSEKSGSPTGGNDGSITGATTDTRRQSRGSQMSFMRNFMGPADQETSPNDYLSPSQAFTDNRMKKTAVLYPNGDRPSAVSLRDEEDYSRPVLRLTNPD